MKYLLAALLFISTNVFATNKYVKTGGSDAANGLTPSTAWATIAKVNASMASINAGDTIFFNGGDTFTGSIVMTKSGTSVAPIVITSYGTGQALFNGYTTLSSWTLVGSGVYYATLSGKKNLLNVVMDNIPQHMGRYPNPDAANGGYLTYEKFTTTTNIVDSQLTASPNWTGAEAVIRTQLWEINRTKITSHVGITINYALTDFVANPLEGRVLSAPAKVGQGYFIQNDLRTLDQKGEWYFDSTASRLYMDFGADLPGSHVIKASSVEKIINVNGRDYITVDNISIDGAGLSGVYLEDGSGLIVRRCTINRSGFAAVQVRNSPSTFIDSNNITYALSNGIQIANFSQPNYRIIGNNVHYVYTIPGMGEYPGDQFTCRGITATAAVTTTSNTNLITRNTVRNVGYSGITFNGSNVTLQFNNVDSACMTLADNAAIYTYQGNHTVYGAPTYNYVNRAILDNVLTNSFGNTDGTTPGTTHFASGIYLDGKTRNINVLRNTIANMPRSGITASGSVNIRIENNILWNDSFAIRMTNSRKLTVNSNTIKHNVFAPQRSKQLSFVYTTDSLKSSISSELNTIAIIDSNTYSLINSLPFRLETTPAVSFLYNLQAWRDLSAKDSHSDTIKVYPTYTSVTSGSNLFANGTFNANIVGVNAGNGSIVPTWDGTSKITGTGSLKITIPTPTVNSYVILHIPIGALVSGDVYRVRFKTLGTTNNGVVRIFTRLTASPFSSQTDTTYSGYGASIKQHEFILHPPTATQSLVLSFEQNSGTTYLDDLEVIKVTNTPINITDSLRLEYNETYVNEITSLPYVYTAANSGEVYNGTITLTPFLGKVLEYTSGTLITADTPVISTIVPSVATATGNPVSLAVTGLHFEPGSLILWNGTSIPTVYNSSTSLTGTISGILNAIANGGTTANVTVLNSDNVIPSNTKVYTLNPIVPIISNISPSSAAVTGASFVLTVNGSRFINGLTGVYWNGVLKPTIFVSSTQVTATISAIDNALANGGTTASVTTQNAGNASFSNGVTYTLLAAAVPLSISYTSVNEPCYGNSAGSVDLTVSGGTAPYTYAWTGPNLYTAATQDITGLKIGTYAVTVNDNAAHTATTSVTITQPTRLSGSGSYTATTSGITTVRITCRNGSVPYVVTTSGSSPITVNTSGGIASFTNQGVGTHSYTITDSHGCAVTVTVVVKKK